MNIRGELCYGCPLHEKKIAIGFAPPGGTGSLGVAVITDHLDAKGASEDTHLHPSSPSGMIFQGILRRAGIDREQLSILGAIQCRPGPQNWLEGRYEEYQAIRHCQVHVANLVESRRPRAILAMGNVPMRTYTGLVGHNLGIKMVRGFIIPGLGPDGGRGESVPWGGDGPERFPAAGIPVIPTYHPSYLLRGSKTRAKDTGGKTEKAEGGMALAGVLRRDLELALQVAKNGYSRPKTNYRFITNRDEAELFYEECKANPHLPIGVDIETPESRSKADDESEIEQVTLPVTQIQFALRKFEGVVFPGFEVEWSREVSDRILNLPNEKYTWNGWSFDEPNLGQYGIKLAGVHHDLMWAWHFLQPDLPKGLQYATSFYAPEMGPWKHLAGVDDHYYGGCDVDSLHRDAEGIFSALRNRGLYNTYDRHVVQLHGVLLRTSARGIPVNKDKQKVFEDFLVKEVASLDADVQQQIPIHIRPLKQKGGLAKAPKSVAALIEGEPTLGQVVVVESELHCAICEVSQKTHATAKDALAEPHEPEWVSDIYIFKECEWKVKEDKTKGSLDEVLQKPATEKGLRWAKVMDFSVNSGDQIKAYILHKQAEELVPRLAKGQDRATALRLCKYQVPMVKDKANKGKLKESTEAKELLKLGKKTGDGIFKSMVEIRQMKKMKVTYVDGWLPDKSGLVHTEFLMAPATGQLSSVSPNVQNCFPGEVEILTERGWTRFDHLNTERVAQYDERSKQISLVLPSELIRQEQKDLVRISTKQQVQLLCTPNHECLVRNRKTGSLKKVAACDYPEDFQQINAGNFVGGRSAFSFSSLILIAALQADGSISKPAGRNPGGQISWYFKKRRKAERLRKALYSEGISYTYKHKNSQFKFYVGRPPEWLASKKHFGSWIMDLDKTSFAFLAEEVWFWDGCYKRRSMYSSSIKHNADWVQILTALSGRRARLREYHNGNPNSVINWQVDAANKDSSMTTNRKIDKVSFRGLVYCVTVPTGNIVTRWNNVVSITGNCPKHSGLGDEFRKTIEAQPGKILLEFDKKSFHAQTLAFEAQDPDYFRLAKIDVHSFVTCHMIKHPQVGEILSWSDKDLTEFLDGLKADKKTLYKAAARTDRPNGSAFKQIRDEQAKKTIFGIVFGQCAASIYDQNEENFESAKDVQRILDIIKEQFKPIFKFQDSIRGVAHSQGWLISRFKYIRRFHDVYQWDPDKWNPSTGSRGGWKSGDDSEAAIAFLPANDAFGMIKEEMLRLEERGANETFGLCNQIHDALKFHCPVELVDSCIETVVEEMSKPSPYLVDPVIAPGGLAIEVGVVMGRNWAHYDKLKNPDGMQDIDLGDWARRKVA